MSVVVVRHDQDSIFRNSNMLSVWPDSWRKWKILYCTWYNKKVTFYIWKYMYMKRCTDYFVSFNNISTSFSHFHMKNGEFVSSGNNYLPLHCLLLFATSKSRDIFAWLSKEHNYWLRRIYSLTWRFQLTQVYLCICNKLQFYKTHRALWYAEHSRDWTKIKCLY